MQTGHIFIHRQAHQLACVAKFWWSDSNSNNSSQRHEGLSMSDTAHKREQGPSITVPVNEALLARVKSAAEREDRSVASYARLALTRALEHQLDEATA